MTPNLKQLTLFILIISAVIGLILYKTLSPINAVSHQTIYYTARGETTQKPSDPIAEAIQLDPTDVPTLLHRLGARIIKTEQVENITIVYAYSPLLSEKAHLKIGTVNLMIAIKETKALAATPLIYGSY